MWERKRMKPTFLLFLQLKFVINSMYWMLNRWLSPVFLFSQMLEVWSRGCCREIQMRARPWSRSGAMPGSTNHTTTKAHARGVTSAAHAQQVRKAPAEEQSISVPSLQGKLTSAPFASGLHQPGMCRYGEAPAEWHNKSVSSLQGS